MMEPLKQLIQLTTPQHFRPTARAGDSEESFVSYLGHSQRTHASQEAVDEAIQVELSPLARLLGSLPSEGRQALIELMEKLPQDNPSRQQLADLLSALLERDEPEQIEASLFRLRILFDRLAQNESEGRQNLLLSLREMSQLSRPTQRYFFDQLDDFLNLSNRDLKGLFSVRNGLSEKEHQDFLRVISNLLKRGVVGTEEVRFRGQKQTTFVETRLGDSRLRRAEPYRRSRFPLDERT